MCWQSHRRISHSPDTWQWSYAHLCTPQCSTSTVWDNRNYFPLTRMGGRWNFKASVQRKKKKTNPILKEGAFLFWSLLSQRRLLPTWLQQCPDHGLPLPSIPWFPATSVPWELLPTLGRGGRCPALAEPPAAEHRLPPCYPGPRRKGLKIKTNGRPRSFCNHELSSCAAPSERHAVRT